MAWEFKQLAEYPSHIERNIIDHVYISNKVERQLVVLDHHPVYYSDHAQSIYIKFTLKLIFLQFYMFRLKIFRKLRLR